MVRALPASFALISGLFVTRCVCVCVCVCGGGLLSLFSFISDLFINYLGRNLPLGWLSASRSLSGQGGGGGRGGGHSFSVFLDV